jgi:hypothetical protein
MDRYAFREMVSCVPLFCFPGALLAADSNAAVLYTNGAARVNGAHVPAGFFRDFYARFGCELTRKLWPTLASPVRPLRCSPIHW